MNRPLRLAVFLSGGGTTLQNFLDQADDGRMPAPVVQVVSSNPQAFGLLRRNAGVPTAVAGAELVRRARSSAGVSSTLAAPPKLI